MNDVIALTGATGFIGQRVVKRLAAAGQRVRILVRDPTRLTTQEEHCDVIAGDLSDPQSLHRFAEGADAVIHLAGATAAPRSAAFHRINVDGTWSMATIAAAAGCARFVHVSSLAAREPALSAYAASKRAAETALAAAGDDLNWVALRPAAVYGPGDRATLPLITQLTRRHALLPGTATARLSLVHVDDLADALVHLARTRDVAGEICDIDDGRAGGYSFGDLADMASQLQDKTVRVHHVPKAMLLAAAYPVAFAAALIGKPSIFYPGKVRELYHPDWVARHNRLHERTRWAPRIGFADGFRTTLEWYRQNDWLPDPGRKVRVG